ncbi:DNA-binding CsgD family transcriptional regulator/tetratricopeptide (TPR) repeat protein [Saccharothrix coeruleofusca]|uniref:helix-turn-helix transcriptional regulator n=1 Tax=Saccharothrix coeruleofusca TaxID=33919 RepID=UPI001AE18752|nr:LuxR family transcriptional regulator [Saccharothrix coeruleofusca]MBP2338929.1 DNA-binding CsgD family transcriptional regulator/tetratricopeptide (TPR) repeat protein [Saccharothrix coeruleofusca]
MRAVTLRLLGRERELERLLARVEDLAQGRGAALLVEGEPGIGKTTLVRAVCENAAARGFRVCRGAGDELGRPLPLLPLLEALATARAEDAAVDPVTATEDRLLARVDDLCAIGPVVLLVDDLQWADPATIAVWRRLAGLVPQLPLLLIGVVRPLPRRDELAALREPRFTVGRLSDVAVAELVAHLVGGVPDRELLRLAAGAGGNPLYLVELVEALLRGGAVRVDATGIARSTGAGVPASLSAAIADRVGFLGEGVRRVLAAAALLGVDFPVADLAAVLGARVVDLLPALQDATVTGVLVDGPAGLSFRHPLVRTALYDSVPVAVRGAWHLEAARALVDSGAGVRRVARQLLAGGDDAPPWVVAWVVRHGATLVAHAPEAAVDLLTRVVEAPQAEHCRAALLSHLAEARFRLGDHHGAEAVALAGLAHGASVDLHWTLAQCRSLTGRSAQTLAEVRRALEAPDLTEADRTRLLVLAARAHWDLGELDDAERLADAVLATGTGDRWATSWALHVRTIVGMARGRMADALPLFERALAVAMGDPATADLRLLLQINQAVTLGELDRGEEAIAAAAEVRQAADRAGNLVRLAQAQSALGQLLLDAGRWDEALVEVDLLADDLKHPLVSRCDHGVAALIHLHRGAPVEARRHLDLAGRDGTGHVVGSLALARSLELEQDGRPAEALRVLAAGYPAAEDLLPETARLAVRLGEREIAEAVRSRAWELVDELDVPHRRAAAAYCQALCDDDPAALLAVAEQACRPLLRAQALGAAAVGFAARGERASARAALGRAVEAHTALGAEWDVNLLLSRLREHGIRRGPHVKHRRTAHGWDSLTPTELRVTELVVAGLSNRQIGERLFMSGRTVATHVSHVLAKLGVRSRTDIAREAVRHRVG